MKIEKNHEQITSNQNDLNSIKFSIDSSESAVPLLIDFLARLYPNPKQTLLFEYVSNAIDSHTVAGKGDVPIEICLPNKMNPFYKVRDFGIGMDHEEVRKIFSVALKSTKRNSNSTIGGFGVGKLVFSPYCGIMFLTTWKNGEKTIYQCRLKDGDGEITPIHNEKSDEPQGVEIKIPVSEYDFQFFKDRAKYSYSFLKTKPIIKSDVDIELGYDSHIDTDNFSILKNKEHYDITDTHSIATVGNIPFPINCGNLFWSYKYKSLLSYRPIVLKFDVGEVDITPSRDQLEYSEKTIDAITKKLDEMKEYLSSIIQKEFDNCANMHDVRINYIKYVVGKTTLTDVIKQLEIHKTFTFGNEKIKYTFNSTSDVKINRVNLNKSNNILKNVEGNYTYGEKVIVVTEDFSSVKRSRRIKKYLNDNDLDKICIFTKRSGGDYDKWVDEQELNVDDFIDIQNLPDPEVIRTTSTHRSYSSRTVKKSKVLRTKDNWVHDVDSWDEIDMDLKNDEGVYTFIKYYKPDGYTSVQIHELEKLLRKVSGTAYDINLIGIRTSEKAKVENNPKLINVEDYFRKLKDAIEDDVIKYNNIKKNISTGIVNMGGTIMSEEIGSCDVAEYILEKVNKYKTARKTHLLDQSEMEVKMDIYYKILNTFGFNSNIKYFEANSVKTVSKLRIATKLYEKKYPLLPNPTYHGYKKEHKEYVKMVNFYKKSLTNTARSAILSV
jgi:hypothetical protein